VSTCTSGTFWSASAFPEAREGKVNIVLARACSRLALYLGIVLTVLGTPSRAQAPAGLYYVHVDHLNTPRAIYNDQQQLVWKWDQQEPFGNNSPNGNPSGLGTFECNVRFPGQYFDKETNLAHNYFRDFDPGLGRYVQSDPIGLRSGLNTYAYVGSNPLRRVDKRGLEFALTPEEPIGAHGVRCTNGTFVVIFDPDINRWECPSIRKCISVHELEGHAAEALRQNPQICSGGASGWYLGSNDENEWNRSEQRAFELELNCLKNERRRTQCDVNCQREIDKKILIVEAYLSAVRGRRYQ